MPMSFRASKERDSSRHHTIVPDGYNLGRDWLVDRAVEGRRWKGMWWKAELEWNESDLLTPGRKGWLTFSYLNFIQTHWWMIGVNHDIPQDGRVAILTVNRV